jgi:hypothetical protein
LCRTAFAKSNASENVGILQIEHQNQVSIALLLAIDDAVPKIKCSLIKTASFFFLVEK